MDLNAQFNKLVNMISNDMKNVGNQIGQIVAKLTQVDQRVAALEKRLAAGGFAGPQQNGNAHPVVNGQVVPGPAVTGDVPDATPLWNGDPNAFYKGDDDAH